LKVAHLCCCVAGFKFFILSISDLSFFEKGRHIQVVFNFASGLREAAPVRLAGVEVGLIRKLQSLWTRLMGENQGAGGCLDQRQYRVPWIPILRSISWNFGEKYLEIIPGSSTNFIKDDVWP